MKLRRAFVAAFDRLYRIEHRAGAPRPSLLRVLNIGLIISSVLVSGSLIAFMIALYVFIQKHGFPVEFDSYALYTLSTIGGGEANLIPRPEWAKQNYINAAVFDYGLAGLLALAAALPISVMTDYAAVIATRLSGAFIQNKRWIVFAPAIVLQGYATLALALIGSNLAGTVAQGVDTGATCLQQPYSTALDPTTGLPFASRNDCWREARTATDRYFSTQSFSVSPSAILARVASAYDALATGLDVRAGEEFYGEALKETETSDALFHAINNVLMPSLAASPERIGAVVFFTAVMPSVWLWVWGLLGGFVWLGGRQKAVADFISKQTKVHGVMGLIGFCAAIALLVLWLVNALVKFAGLGD